MAKQQVCVVDEDRTLDIRERLDGGFAPALRFSGIGSTKMACPSGTDIETTFLPALLEVAKWRVVGRQLELSDSAGMVLARFDATAPK